MRTALEKLKVFIITDGSLVYYRCSKFAARRPSVKSSRFSLSSCQTFIIPHLHLTVMQIKIAQFGLGPIGIETLKLAAAKPWAEIEGGIDIAPEKVGRDLGDLAGMKSLHGLRVVRSVAELPRQPDLVFHTAVSRFRAAFEQIEPLARRGISVVSSCEELVFPQLRESALAAKLDRICRNAGARVVGTGVNPGFVMDVLPLCLTGVSREVRAIHIQRVVNASRRREPLQRKIGSGLAPEEFRGLFRAGKAGHAGLKESLALIAHSLGWKLARITESGDAVVAKRTIRTRFLEVRQGQTCGLHQRAEGRVEGKIRITLDLKMYLDAEDPRDAIQIEGEPPMDLVIKGGTAGDEATVAALVNTAARLLAAPPGLLLMTDLTLPRFSPNALGLKRIG
jgi:4-hydroxy-tetrahydrodipicolinate reductase